MQNGDEDFLGTVSPSASDPAPHPALCSCAACHGNFFDPDNNTATSFGTASSSNKESFTPEQAATNLLRKGYSWSDTTVTYGFFSSAPSSTYGGGESEGFAPFDAEQQAGAIAAVGIWDEIIDIEFTFTSDGDNADMRFGQSSYPAYAHAYYPGNFSEGVGGDVWFKESATSLDEQDFGSYGFTVTIHEIGHAIGLAHPGNYNGSGFNYDDHGAYVEDTRQYSLMSYWDASNTGAEHLYNYAQTPLLHDILAAQNLYGAEMSTRTEDTTYGFNVTSGLASTVYDFSTNTNPIIAIWDAGGNDTLDVSGYSTNQVLNLTPGEYMDVGLLTKNVVVAINASIENAVGGSGNDSITGSTEANVLTGGAGNDTITGGSGNDTLNGGTGTDQAVFSGSQSDYVVSRLSTGGYQVAGTDGQDTLSGIELVSFGTESAVSISSLAVTTSNQRPVTTGSDITISAGSSVALDSIFEVRDADGDAITSYEVEDTGAGGATLAISTIPTAQSAVLTVTDLSTLSISAGDEAGSSTFRLRASDATGFGEYATITVTTTAAVTDDFAASTSTTGTITPGTTGVLGTIGESGDVDWLAVSLTAGSRYFINLKGADSNGGTLLNPTLKLYDSSGTLIATDTDTGTGGDSLLVYTATTSGTFYVSAESATGSGTGTYTASVSVGTTTANVLPTVTAVNTTVAAGDEILISTLFNVTDDNGDQIVNYALYDPNADDASGRILVNNTTQAALTQIETEDLTTAIYQARSTPGTEQIYLAANDGTGWSNSVAVTLTITGASDDYAGDASTTGTVAVGGTATGSLEISDDTDWFSVNLTAGQQYIIANEGTATNGGTLADPFLSIFDSTGALLDSDDDGGTGDNAQLSFTPTTTGNYFIGSSSFATTGSVTSGLSGTYTLSVTLGGGVDNRPVVSTSDVTVSTGGSIPVSTAFTVTDADGDAITSYQLFDASAGSTSGALAVNGVTQTTGDTITVSSLDTVTFTGGTAAGVDSIWLRAADAGGYGDWESAEILTTVSGSNIAPVVSATNVNIGSGTSSAVSTIFSVTDSNGDAITAYELWDENAGASSAVLTVSGTAQTAQTLVSVTSLSDVAITGGSSASVDQIWLRAFDGTDWSSWTSAEVTTSATSNSVPIIAAANQSVAAGATVSITDVFTVSDAEGNAITAYEVYDGTATASSGAITLNGTAQTAGNVISFTDPSTIAFAGGSISGTDTIWMRAFDGTGWSAWTSAVLTTTGSTTTDDVGSTTSTAGSINLGGTVNGSLEVAGDADWYGVTLAAGTEYTIDLKGAPSGVGTLADPRLYVYDAAGALVGGNDDGGTGLESQLAFTPSTTQTYYLAARHFDDSVAGTYELSITGGSSVNVAPTVTGLAPTLNTSGSAQISELFTVVDANGDAITQYQLWDNGSASSSGYFAINGVKQSALTTLTVTDISTVSYVGGTASGSETIWLRATDGTAYSDWVATTVTTSATSVSDDFGSTTATAGTISLGGSQSGTLETAGDDDWFGVSLTAGSTYTIDLKGSDSGSGTLSDPTLYLVDASGTTTLTSNDDGGTGRDSQITYTPTSSGTVYLSARSFGDALTGTYEISISAGSTSGGDDFAGNTATTGTVAVGGTATGELEENGDADWFAVTLTAGTTYTIEQKGSSSGVGTLSDTHLFLYDSSGSYLTDDDDSGLRFESQLSYTPSTSGTYYVAARGYNDARTGTYQVAVTEASTATSTDIGDTISTTGSLAVGSSLTGELEESGDDDWYAVTLTAGVTYTFQHQGSPSGGGTLSDPRLFLHDSLGTFLTQNDDGGTGRDSLLTYTPSTSGTYFLSARAFGDNKVGTYTLSAALATSASTPGPDDQAETKQKTEAYKTAPITLDSLISPNATPVLTIADVTVTEGDSGKTDAIFTLSLSEASASTVTFSYATSDGSASSASDDYTAAEDRVTIAAGETVVTIPVQVTGDTTIETDETFGLTLFNVSGATLTNDVLLTTATATITNDDGVTNPTITVDSPTVSEGDSGAVDLTFTVSLSAAATGAVTVNYATSDGTASSTSNDYQPASGTLTFATGETSKTVSVSVIGDTTTEEDETVSLVLSNTAGGSFVGEAAIVSGTGTITDDDSAQATIAAVQVTEADSFNQTVTLTVDLVDARSSDTTIVYETQDGTATAGTDYTAVQSSLTIPAGQTTGTFTVDVLGDIAIEENETFSIRFAEGATTQALSGSDVSSVAVTIVENDGFTWSDQGYLDANPDLVSANISTADALGHYVSFGYTEGRQISFDGTAYLGMNPDVAAAGFTSTDAITHYINFGKAENRPLDADDYLNANPDLVAAGITNATAGSHFVNFGRDEGRSLGFDAAGYLMLNPDLSSQTVPQLREHFTLFGEAEGRSLFTPEGYIAANSDVASAGGDVYLHYTRFGQTEGRSILPTTVSSDSLLSGETLFIG